MEKKIENKFNERFYNLRKERNISIRQISKATNICEKTLRSWERGKTKPRVRHLVILVKFFNVKADYLLGLKDNR